MNSTSSGSLESRAEAGLILIIGGAYTIFSLGEHESRCSYEMEWLTTAFCILYDLVCFLFIYCLALIGYHRKTTYIVYYTILIKTLDFFLTLSQSIELQIPMLNFTYFSCGTAILNVLMIQAPVKTDIDLWNDRLNAMRSFNCQSRKCIFHLCLFFV